MPDFLQLSASRDLPACAACQIRSLGVCARSHDAEIARLEATKRYRSYPAGTTIAFEGDTLNHVGTVMLGQASLSRILANGRRQTVGLLHPGDFLGRPGRPVTPFTVETITDVELCSFGYKVFDDLLSRSPDLHAKFTEIMLDELDAARDWMVMLGRKTAREKLCSFLIYLAYRQNRGGSMPQSVDPIAVYAPMTRDQIADFLSLTMETVSRQMTELRRDGLCEPVSRHKLRLPDFNALLVASGEDADGGMWA